MSNGQSPPPSPLPYPLPPDRSAPVVDSISLSLSLLGPQDPWARRPPPTAPARPAGPPGSPTRALPTATGRTRRPRCWRSTGSQCSPPPWRTAAPSCKRPRAPPRTAAGPPCAGPVTKSSGGTLPVHVGLYSRFLRSQISRLIPAFFPAWSARLLIEVIYRLDFAHQFTLSGPTHIGGFSSSPA